MSFMQMFIYQKGALYYSDCQHCGTTNYTHEWINDDHNERRDAMEKGTLACDECQRAIGPDGFTKAKRPHYAGRYSAPGYLDCTQWQYDTNKQRLAKQLRSDFG